MPTARDLLEQADALMRRNRKRGKGRRGGPPTLTDALGIDRGESLPPTLLLAESAVAEADPIALDTLSDVPILTDVVDVWPSSAPDAPHRASDIPTEMLDDALEADATRALAEAPTATPMEVPETEDSPWPATDDAPLETRGSVPVSPAGSAVMLEADGTAPLPPATQTDDRTSTTAPLATTPPLEEEFILEIPAAPESERPAVVPAAVPVPAIEPAPSRLTPGSHEWDALAEEIRMQVLQRLDLFTDTGLREQLGARLQPIVDRASAELVETINHALGELVRGYVAEAIEREIESWRKRSS